MLGSLANAWKIPELRTRLMFTFAMLAAYRLGAFIPLPGVRPEVLGGGLQTNNPITGLFGTFTGGAFNNFAVFSLGTMPYITAAIVMQLMTVAIPRLQELAKEGETGQQKITQYTRYFTLVLALIQSVAMVFFFRSAQGGGALAGTSPIEILVAVVTLTAGVMLTMWFGELISQRGLGNGISLIITASILSQLPLALQFLRENGDVLTVVILALLAVMIVAAIVFVNEGQRRIPITYAKRQVGRRMSQGGTTYLPLKVNMAGVIPIIFASSLLLFPVVLAQLAAGGDPNSILGRLAAFFNAGGAPYLILYALLIIMFTYFYTAVQFNPVEHADNLKKSGGYVPGYRPGQPTAVYLNNVLTRITLFGALFLAVVAVLPYMISGPLGLGDQIFLGGTSMLIVVGVSLDTVRQLESQLMMRNYEGFLRKRRGLFCSGPKERARERRRSASPIRWARSTSPRGTSCARRLSRAPIWADRYRTTTTAASWCLTRSSSRWRSPTLTTQTPGCSTASPATRPRLRPWTRRLRTSARASTRSSPSKRPTRRSSSGSRGGARARPRARSITSSTTRRPRTATITDRSSSATTTPRTPSGAGWRSTTTRPNL